MEMDREVMRLFIDRVEIGTEPDEWGHWLKEIVFRFPVTVEGYEGRSVGVKYEDPETEEEAGEDSESFQPGQNTVETVVLQSKTPKEAPERRIQLPVWGVLITYKMLMALPELCELEQSSGMTLHCVRQKDQITAPFSRAREDCSSRMPRSVSRRPRG